MANLSPSTTDASLADPTLIQNAVGNSVSDDDQAC
jgi:hypothetical protein